MFAKFMPKEKTFFELFNTQSSVIAGGLRLFETLLADYLRQPELVPQIKTVEEEADKVAHRIFLQLNETFVTPFDREDIQALVHRMDDVMDMVEKANARMAIYAMPAPPDGLQAMAVVLRTAFDIIARAVSMLDSWKNKEAVLKLCIEVNSLENRGDMLLRSALQKLFQQAGDPLYVIKAKEIYESLEEAIDRCEDLANIIETILLKNA